MFTISLLYLDDYHLGDPLFLQGIGRAVARLDPAYLRPIIIHGQGEYVQRKLEGEGIFLNKRGGVFEPDSAPTARLLDSALRDLNRWLTGLFTEAGVPAVGLHGADRGMVEMGDGGVRIARSDVLTRLLDTQVVPLIASGAVDGAGATGAVDPAAVVRALVQEFGERAEVVMFTTNNLGGIMQGRDPVAQVNLAQAAERGVVADRNSLETFVLDGARVLLTNTVRYPNGGAGRGTWVSP